MTIKNIAVFASGNGSNFQSLVDAEKEGELSGHVKILISDKPNALVLRRAEKENVEAYAFDPKKFENKKAYEKEIADVLAKHDIDLIVLAGYMRIVGETLLSAYKNKMINLHPSLLPAFSGKDAIGQAISYGVKCTGVTVHFVDEGMDTGPIIKQQAIEVLDTDTVDTLAEKIHQVEHKLLVETVNLINTKTLIFKDRSVKVKNT